MATPSVNNVDGDAEDYRSDDVPTPNTPVSDLRDAVTIRASRAQLVLLGIDATQVFEELICRSQLGRSSR